MSLQEPHLKMSKSDTDPRSRILITDSADEIHRKIMSALTDSTNSVSYDPEGTSRGLKSAASVVAF